MFQLRELRDELYKLKPDHILVLHGMTLIGKSCLVSAAIQHKNLLKDAFNNKVFWVNLGEIYGEVDKDKIFLEMCRHVFY